MPPNSNQTQLSEQLNSINQELIYSVGEADCASLSDTKDTLTFEFSQGEADTIMLYVYAPLRSSSYINNIFQTK